jgi:multicomponent Na+:H+ antiporter subunit E
MATRFVIFVVIWCIFDGIKPISLVAGAITAGLVTWSSLQLFPASTTRVRIFPFLALALHFMWSSIVAALEVAKYAFRRQPGLNPGFITYDCDVPAGTKRDLYLSMVSLMPGSLPVDVDENGRVIIHCLDINQPIAKQMADEEARLIRTWEEPPK